PVGLPRRVPVAEVVLLGSGRGDLVERRVGDVLADLTEDGDLRPPVDLDVADGPTELRGKVLRQRLSRLVEVVVRIEDASLECRTVHGPLLLEQFHYPMMRR